MKPHLAYINNTLIRKQLANEARNEQTSYRKYMGMVEQARQDGFNDDHIVSELEAEKWRIEHDLREGDAIFQQGLANAKTSCTIAIARIISEIKGQQAEGE